MSSNWDDFLATIIQAALAGQAGVSGGGDWMRPPAPMVEYEDGSFGPAAPDIKSVAGQRGPLAQFPNRTFPGPVLPQVGPATIGPPVYPARPPMTKIGVIGRKPDPNPNDIAQRRQELDRREFEERMRQRKLQTDAIRQKDTSQP